MQKKVLAALSVSLLSVGLSMNSLAATADSVDQSAVVKFTGKIVDTACEIGTDIEGEAVPLGTWPTIFFNKDGAETDKVAFNIEISKCKLTEAGTGYSEAMGFPVDRVKLIFRDDGTVGSGRDNRGGSMFLTQTTRPASNVGIQVEYESTTGYQTVFNSSETAPIALSDIKIQTLTTDNPNNLKDPIPNPELYSYAVPMRANIVRVNNNAVGSGEVNGQMTVTLSYE